MSTIGGEIGQLRSLKTTFDGLNSFPLLAVPLGAAFVLWERRVVRRGERRPARLCLGVVLGVGRLVSGLGLGCRLVLGGELHPFQRAGVRYALQRLFEQQSARNQQLLKQSTTLGAEIRSEVLPFAVDLSGASLPDAQKRT